MLIHIGISLFAAAKIFESFLGVPMITTIIVLSLFTVTYTALGGLKAVVMTENIHRGEYLRQSKAIRKLNVPAIDAVRAVYQRGVEAGVFRGGVDPVDLHMSISALSFFNTANRHTFALIFERDMTSPAAMVARRDSIIEMIVRFVRK